jgi:transmembrane protein DUF3566
VSQTKRTPDEPGHGSVATGRPAGQSNGSTAGGNGSGNGSAPDAAKPEGAPAADTAGAAGSTGAAEAQAGAPPADAATTARFRLPTPPEAARADGSSGSSAPSGSSKATEGSTSSAAAGPSAMPAGPATTGGAADGAHPTVQPVPPAGGVAPSAERGRPAGGPPAEARTVVTKHSPDAAPPVPAAAGPSVDAPPAPAVPAPGPAAAPPPPWLRMPGRDAADTAEAAEATPATGSLLGEGPTAFLEAPRYAPPTPAGGETAVGDGGGWTRATRSRPPRQAALQLKKLDPWSVLKLALVLAVVLFFIWLVAVGVLYGVLDGMGVWDRLNGTYADLVSGEAQTGSQLISAGRVFGLAAVVGAINSLLFAVAVTVGAFVYNVSADLVGGIEVTLSERD